MTAIAVWMLMLVNYDGGLMKVENIATFEDCERLRLRSEQAAAAAWNKNGGYRRVVGSCTQVTILVPAQPAQAPRAK